MQSDRIVSEDTVLLKTYMADLETNSIQREHTLRFIVVRKLAPYLLVLLIPLIIYSPSLSFGFIYDDAELIVRKAAPDSLAAWKLLLSSAYFEGLPYYRPVPALLFGIERLLFGLNPAPYHWTNFFLTAFLSFAILKLFRRSFFGFSTPQAAALTLLAVLHPVMSSSVYLLSGREALLAALFAVNAGDRVLHSRGRFDWTSGLWVLLALLCRESSSFLVPLIFTLLILRQNQLTRRQFIQDFARFLLLVLIYGALRFLALSGNAPAPVPNPDVMLVPASFLYALKGIIMPTLSVQYEPLLFDWFSSKFLVAAIFVLSLMAGVFRHLGIFHDKVARTLLVILLVSLLPTANIFIQETPFDERHLVMPLIVSTALFGWIMVRLVDSKRAPKALILTVVAGGLAVISFSRQTVFVSDEAFLNHWFQTAPQQAKVNVYQIVRSLVLLDWQQAMQYANRSIDLQENNLALLYRARVNLRLGNLGLAYQDLERSASLDNQNADVLCERLLLARVLSDTDNASQLLGEAQAQGKPLWCLTASERGRAQRYWTEDLNTSEFELNRLPLFNREEWRRFQEFQKTLR